MIPKLLHHIWVGSPPPMWALKNIEAWAALHPDWEMRLWTDANMPGLYNQGLYDRAEQLVPEDAIGQFRADLARYEILYQYGGFYADVDTVPLRPIDDALSGHSEFAAAEDPNYIGNTVLAAEPDSPLLLALIRNLEAHVKAVGRAHAAVLSGPQYLTPIWRKLGGYVDKRTELWFPYSWVDVKRGTEDGVEIHPDAYMIHEWEHQRTLRGRGRG